jgi:hypothetical protein
MQGSSDNSFIPKRGAAKRKQIGGSRQIYIFTYISYILMFATLLSSGGVYLYAQYINGQLDSEIESLNAEIGSFSQADMERVTQFDLRLTQAKDRLDNSVSVASIFEALQSATIDTVQIESLTMEREGDEQFVVDALVQTNSFDSTIFQRGVFMRNETIQTVDISEVQNVLATEDVEGLGVATKPVVSFKALLEIPLDDVLAQPQRYQIIQENETQESEVGDDVQENQVNEQGSENDASVTSDNEAAL